MIGVLFLFSCKKKKDPEPMEGFSLQNGMLVLCEGLFQQNNSAISWVDQTAGSVTPDLFLNQVGRGLGDTGNDILKYGGKLYVAVNVSSTIEILDGTSFKSLKQISMMDGSNPKQPRQLLGYGSNVFITCFDGYVDVLDTASMTITNRIQVGANPEGIAAANSKIYVSNSGGLNYPDLDSTVSVIDPLTLTESTKITVGLNPGNIISDQNGDVYLITRGDYGNIPAQMYRIDNLNNVSASGIEVDYIVPFNSDFLLVYSTSGMKHLGVYNASMESISTSDLINISNVQTIYGVNYSPYSGKITVSDAMGYVNSGKVYVFDSNGNTITNYQVGLNPSKIIFYE